jgi:predicted porin
VEQLCCKGKHWCSVRVVADYALSKRSTVYMGYENWDNKNAALSATVNSGDRKITSVGVRHAF